MRLTALSAHALLRVDQRGVLSKRKQKMLTELVKKFEKKGCINSPISYYVAT